MAAPATTVNIARGDSSIAWGFRLQGGRDFREPLSIKKVTPSTPAASAGLRAGDGIMAIGGYDATPLTHAQASHMIKQATTLLQITVSKGSNRVIKPSGPVKFTPGAQPPPVFDCHYR